MVEVIKSFLENVIIKESYYFDRLIQNAPKYKRLEVSWILFHINASKLLFQEEKQIALPEDFWKELSKKELPERTVFYYLSPLMGNLEDKIIYDLLNESVNHFFTNENLLRDYNTLKRKHFCSKFYESVVEDLKERVK